MENGWMNWIEWMWM